EVLAVEQRRRRKAQVAFVAAFCVLLAGASGVIYLKYLDAKEQERIAGEHSAEATRQEGIAARRADDATAALGARDKALAQGTKEVAAKEQARKDEEEAKNRLKREKDRAD